MTSHPSIRNTGVPWQIRAYRSGDEAQLVQLFSRSYGKEITEAHWRWKLKSRASPFENVWVAYNADGIIGQYAVVPIPLRIDGTETLLLSGVDAMVDPSYRRQGVWTSLLRHCHQFWTKEGASLIIGLPNEQWGSRTQATGWESLFPLRYHRLLLRPLSMILARSGLRKTNAFRPLERYFSKRVWSTSALQSEIRTYALSQTDDALDLIWSMASMTKKFAAAGGATWIDWRYLSQPDRKYLLLIAERRRRPVGYAVYWFERTGGVDRAILSDLVSVPGAGAAHTALLGAVIRDAADAGAAMVLALAVPGTEEENHLKKMRFSRRKHAFQVMTKPLNSSLDLTELRDPLAWHLAPGHFDIV